MSEVSEKANRPRSRTPCLDENRVDENESCAENNSKEIELSDISDDEDEQQWPECNSKSGDDDDDKYTNGNQNSSKANGSGGTGDHQKKQSYSKDSAFKKITRSNRDRNYRDNVRRRRRGGGDDYDENYEFQRDRNYRKTDNSRRKEIERYNVRKVVANRDFSISRSRSRSYSPRRNRSRAEYPSPKRDNYPHHPRRSVSPAASRQQRRKSRGFSPISISPPPSRNSSLLSDRLNRNKHQYNRRSLSIERRGVEAENQERRLSRSRHKHKSIEKSSRRKKHKLKDHHKKHKKSRSKSKRRSSSPSLSPEPAMRNINVTAVPSSSSPPARPRQILNSNLPQENIKIILKNDDAFTKRPKIKKRDKKGTKKEKISRKEVLKEKKLSSSSLSSSLKPSKEQQQTKEVFASGDNILISVCFNNNNNNETGGTAINNNSGGTHSNNDHTKSQKNDIIEERGVSLTKTKASKKRPASPIPSAILAGGSVSSASESYERRQRKHKRKKSKRRHVQGKSSPKTPPMNPPPTSSSQSTLTKRKIDMKPIAIIDLEKSPGKEITQSPKEVIILSDSDGESAAKKRDTGTSKDIVIIEDTILEKGNLLRNHSHTPTHATPESPPLAPLPPQQPVLKFALKSKSNILPFNLLHDQAEETEETSGNANSNATNEPQQQQPNKNANNSHKEQQQGDSTILTDEKAPHNQNEAYDPFEPTKSGSNSPVTPPPPIEPSNEIGKTSRQLDSLNEKLQMGLSKDSNQIIPGLGSEEHQMQSVPPSSSLWNKKSSQQQPITPPLPPSFVFSSSSSVPVKQQHASLYDGIYGCDLKTPVVPSPAKATKSSITDKNKNNSNNNDDDDDDDDRTPYSPSSDGYDYEPQPSSTSVHPSKINFESHKHSDLDTQSSEPSGSYSFERNDESTSKIVTTPLKLTTSTLNSFNSSMRSTSSGLQFVNKAELSIFEKFLPTSQQKSPLVKRQSNSSFIRAKMSRFASSMNENGSPPHRSGGPPFSNSLMKQPPVIDDSILDDDVPSSAVDLVNKDKFLKKSLRIERVAEEVKLVLKPHYNKKHITKEEYKEILRKSVPKICHNKTGEINIQKITQLIEAYIKKVRYKRKSGGMASSI